MMRDLEREHDRAPVQGSSTNSTAVELLLSRHEALVSISSTTGNKQTV